MVSTSPGSDRRGACAFGGGPALHRAVAAQMRRRRKRGREVPQDGARRAEHADAQAAAVGVDDAGVVLGGAGEHAGAERRQRQRRAGQRPDLDLAGAEAVDVGAEPVLIGAEEEHAGGAGGGEGVEDGVAFHRYPAQ